MTTLERLHDPSSPAKRTVLVVDDESSILTLVSRHVSALGHRPLTALSADQALKTLASGESGPIDTVIVNIVMPGHDGAWLIDQLAAHYPWVRVVIATGLDELDPRISLGPNVVAYLVKPFRAAELRDVLDIPDLGLNPPKRPLTKRVPRKILVVDDDAGLCQALARVLVDD